MHQQTSALYTA